MRKLPVEIIKDKSGVTLVELIIGIVMFSILTISVSLIFAPTLDIYVQVNELAELNSLANNIANQIAADLTRAGDVRIIGDGTANEILEMDIAGAVTDYKVDSNGLAAKNSKLLMGAPYYKHKTVDIKYEELQINNKP
ncbi:MAG: prepilin-type N-terminal cleavage/methylation domain-containing protein, partial [Clostridiales bacterium]